MNNDFVKRLILQTFYLLCNAGGFETFIDVKKKFNMIELHFKK